MKCGIATIYFFHIFVNKNKNIVSRLWYFFFQKFPAKGAAHTYLLIHNFLGSLCSQVLKSFLRKLLWDWGVLYALCLLFSPYIYVCIGRELFIIFQGNLTDICCHTVCSIVLLCLVSFFLKIFRYRIWTFIFFLFNNILLLVFTFFFLFFLFWQKIMLVGCLCNSKTHAILWENATNQQ